MECMSVSKVSDYDLDNWRSLSCMAFLGKSETLWTTMPWLRWLVTGLSLQRTRFAPGSIYVGFVVDKVALGQAFLRLLQCSPVSIIPLWLSKHISSGG
jgi:hypothetical protein